jgi:hypothetical protein
MMDNVSAKPGNLVTVTRMSGDNLAFVVGWRPGDWREPSRFVMLRFIQPERLTTAGALPYDTRDLEVIS